MLFGDVSFSVAAHAAWLPGIDSAQAWQQWLNGDLPAAGSGEPAVKSMPPMLRRRASSAGKLALEAATTISQSFQSDIHLPVVFASRHGECARSVELLQELAAASPLSPTAFSLSVHNANAGLFSIAQGSRGNSIAIAAGASTIEHAVIDACALLADGASQVLLVASDGLLPAVFSDYADCQETPFGWAWLMQAAGQDSKLPTMSLQWRASQSQENTPEDEESGGIRILRFFLSPAPASGLTRQANGRDWHWMRHA